jgi:hypothetical protein
MVTARQQAARRRNVRKAQATRAMRPKMPRDRTGFMAAKKRQLRGR